MSNDSMSPESATRGWDAITEALTRLYRAQEPRHIAYQPGLHFGSGLQGCSAYWTGDHWHYVSYGLTELWEKEEGADPGTSGWGYELTIRVPGQEDDVPGWPFALLEAVARHTHDAAHPFSLGDRLDTGAPLTGEPGTRLQTVTFAADPELSPVDSPNGRFEFRQLVGITPEELELMKRSSTTEVLDQMKTHNPLLITDPGRARGR